MSKPTRAAREGPPLPTCAAAGRINAPLGPQASSETSSVVSTCDVRAPFSRKKSTTPRSRPFAHTEICPADLVGIDWPRSPLLRQRSDFFGPERKSARLTRPPHRPASAALPEAARTCRSRVEVSRERRGGAAREPRESRVCRSSETHGRPRRARRRFVLGVRGGLRNPRSGRGARRPTRRRREPSDRSGRDVVRAEAPGACQRRSGELVGARGCRSEPRRAANGRGRATRTQVRGYPPSEFGDGALASLSTPRARGAPAGLPLGAFSCPRCTQRRLSRSGTRAGWSAVVSPRLPRARALSTSFSCTTATAPGAKG